MKISRTTWVIIAIFLLSFGFRLIFSLQTNYYTEDSSYFVLRQAEYIQENGVPQFLDSYSYGGRYYIFLPVFHYIVALMGLFLDIAILSSIVLNLVSSMIIIIVYKIVKFMYQNERLGLFCAFLSGAVPVFVSKTINNLSVYSLTIPLTFLVLYFFLRINITKKPRNYLLLFILLVLLSPTTIYLVFAYLFYVILAFVMGIKIGREQGELILFSVPFAFWFYFVVFKEALFIHGIDIIWQNLPNIVLSRYFYDATIIGTIYKIGLIPLIAGIGGIYLFFTKKKGKSSAFFVSFASVITFMLWFKFIPLDLGLIYLGIIMVILSSVAFIEWVNYLKRTKFSIAGKYLTAVFIILFSMTSVIPALTFSQAETDEAISGREIAIIDFFQNLTESNSTILTTIYDGHLVSYYAKRKTIVDSNFIFVDDLDSRLSDVRTMYLSAVSPDSLLEKYNIDYIYFSDQAKEFYNISKITYVDDKCFIRRFGNQLIEVRCKKGGGG